METQKRKYEAGQLTKEGILISVLDQDNEVLNKVVIDPQMNIKNLFTKKSGLSHAQDKTIIDFVKDTGFIFSDFKKKIEVIKQTQHGIYFNINSELHFYHKSMNSIVLCRETAPGKYRYNYGSNLNAPQEREFINLLKAS